MVYVVFSVDPSIHFLYSIFEEMFNNRIEVDLIKVSPSIDSYERSLERIYQIESESLIIFLGHGQSNQLYGGEQLDTFPKKPFIKLNDMRCFEGKYAFLLACDSANLAKSSFVSAKAKKMIGFGRLPTEMYEVNNDKKLSSEGITSETIELFKVAIAETVSVALLEYIKRGNNDFSFLKNYLSLLIDTKINEAVLTVQDRNLADLLFNMKTGMAMY